MRDDELTENEGSLLGVVARQQPITAYQLLLIYAQSPVSSFNSSKGAIYPIIKRLKSRGLLRGEKIKGDKRGTEALSCTKAGLDALKAWVRNVQPSHTLLADPLRSRIQFLDLLSREEQLEWIVDSKRLVEEKRAELTAYNHSVEFPFQEVVHAAAEGSLEMKSRWLDQLMFAVVKP
jgi:DNA-binding PadR family transcriptional regulator